MIEGDLGLAWDSLMNFIFIKYKGINIERVGTSFKVFGKIFPTLYLAQKKVDLFLIHLNNSIQK